MRHDGWDQYTHATWNALLRFCETRAPQGDTGHSGKSNRQEDAEISVSLVQGDHTERHDAVGGEGDQIRQVGEDRCVVCVSLKPLDEQVQGLSSSP